MLSIHNLPVINDLSHLNCFEEKYLIKLCKRLEKYIKVQNDGSWICVLPYNKEGRQLISLQINGKSLDRSFIGMLYHLLVGNIPEKSYVVLKDKLSNNIHPNNLDLRFINHKINYTIPEFVEKKIKLPVIKTYYVPKNKIWSIHINKIKILDDLSHFLPYPEDYIRHRISYFESFIDVIDDKTWLWNGALRGAGYGKFTLSHKTVNNGKQLNISAHRFIYEIINGKITNNLHVMHKDNNKLNIHPSNLSLGTHQDNMRGVAVDKLFNNKLSDEIVQHIPELYLSGMTVEDIAFLYNRNVITIRHILFNRTYTNIPRKIIESKVKYKPIFC